jgi:hypothetical protein
MSLKRSSGPACPYCNSGDIWQPHVRTWLDGFLDRIGFGRYECRKCRRGLFLRTPAGKLEVLSDGSDGEGPPGS